VLLPIAIPSNGSDRCSGAFAIEDFDSSAIEMIGTLLGFSDADDPELAEFRKRADQTECNAFTRRGVEEELAPFALLKYCAA
jgi:hypothetical protein